MGWESAQTACAGGTLLFTTMVVGGTVLKVPLQKACIQCVTISLWLCVAYVCCPLSGIQLWVTNWCWSQVRPQPGFVQTDLVDIIPIWGIQAVSLSEQLTVSKKLHTVVKCTQPVSTHPPFSGSGRTCSVFAWI
jgi:hypothetical protein